MLLQRVPNLRRIISKQKACGTDIDLLSEFVDISRRKFAEAS